MGANAPHKPTDRNRRYSVVTLVCNLLILQVFACYLFVRGSRLLIFMGVSPTCTTRAHPPTPRSANNAPANNAPQGEAPMW